eukprot:4398243-Amphidinium_carterae.1
MRALGEMGTRSAFLDGAAAVVAKITVSSTMPAKCVEVAWPDRVMARSHRAFCTVGTVFSTYIQ